MQPGISEKDRPDTCCETCRSLVNAKCIKIEADEPANCMWTQNGTWDCDACIATDLICVDYGKKVR